METIKGDVKSVVYRNEDNGYTVLTLSVDGEETKITPIGGSLLAFPLQPGEHTIKLVYYPQGFWIGLAVSIVALAAFIAACVFFCVIKKKKKATASAEAEKTTDK